MCGKLIYYLEDDTKITVMYDVITEDDVCIFQIYPEVYLNSELKQIIRAECLEDHKSRILGKGKKWQVKRKKSA